MICQDRDRTRSAAGGEAPAVSEDVGYNGPLQGPVLSHMMVSPGRVSRSLAYQPPDRGGIRASNLRNVARQRSTFRGDWMG